MKLVDLNIGIKIDNASQVRDFLLGEKADIITLQEVIRPLDKSVFSMYRSKEVLDAALKSELPQSFFGPLWVTEAFTKDGGIYRDFGGFIEQGNQVLSRFLMSEAKNVFFYKSYSYEIDWTHFRSVDHPRAVQVVELEVQGKRLQILNLHGIWNEDKLGDDRTIAECTFVLNEAKKKDIATIIVGDFNLLPSTKSIEILSHDFRNLITEYSINSTRPGFHDGLEKGGNAVDYIFVNDAIQVNSFTVLDSEVSDHFPLILDFDIL